MVSPGLAQSVQVRLVRHAHALNVDPNLVLARYATERLLYRLSRSPHADRFVLKGALLMLVWLGEAIRPTRDADLAGLGDLDGEALVGVFAELCAIQVQPDGLEFDAGSIRVAAIRPEDAYGGQRITLMARLGPARLRVQVDVGIGDVVTPPGSSNSRMRDFFDVYALAAQRSFDGGVLSAAVRATFERRQTPPPSEPPIALTPEFAGIEGKRAQWTGFLRRNRLGDVPGDLATVVEQVARFALPVLMAPVRKNAFAGVWQPGGPWGVGA